MTFATTAVTSLQRRWLVALILYLLVTGAVYLYLAERWVPAGRWLMLAILLGGLNLANLWWRLPLNRRADSGELLAGLGAGNWLTLSRGIAISLTGAFLVADRPAGSLAWLPVLFYTAADIADYFDGYLARRANHATQLGEYLDVSYDGLGMLLVSLLAVRFGQLPAWYLLLGLARYLFLIGIWLRQKLGWPVYPMHGSVHRRVFAGFQMGFMSVVLWPIVPPLPATIAGTIFALPTALGFLRDWFITAGTFAADNRTYRRVQQFLYFHSTSWLPLLLRLTCVLALIWVFWRAAPIWQPASWVELFTGWGLPLPALWATLCALLGLVALFSQLLGAMTRVWSLFYLFPIGFDLLATGQSWLHLVAIAATCALMILGPGWLALWRPELPYLLRRAGESEPSA